ncbi:retrovirus-related pol polyprotein from transposon TNT 1-94 [Tanacetum coccineum]
MERFKNAIFKQREEINGKEERSNIIEVTPDNTEKPTKTETEIPIKEVETMSGAENGAKNELIKTPKNEEAVEESGSQHIAYYLTQKINENLIEGLVNNNRFNNFRSGTRVRKKKGKEYKILPGGPVCDAILKKKITKKEDIRGNFEIPCSIRGLKYVNALVDQGSNVNVMPYSTYMKFTDERPDKTDIRLSLASHSYIYPLGIAEDVLVEVAKHVYPVDFVILDIKENENRPFILGTPFLITAKASIKFDKGTVTLRSRKSKRRFEVQTNEGAKISKARRPLLLQHKEGLKDEGEVHVLRNSFLFRYFSFGRHLEELHVTWPHLEKKQTRLRAYINIAEEFLYSGWRRRHKYNMMPSQRRSRQRHKIPRRLEKVDSNVIPNSPDMCNDDIQIDQNAEECDDERVALANLIANLKLNIDENKKIQNQLKKANTSLTQELKECKSNLKANASLTQELKECKSNLEESNTTRDSCLIALQSKQTELETYKTLNDRIVDYDKLERKLNETLGLLAQKEIDIKEGLKLKAYEISVVKEKHDELVKQSFLTKSHYEGLVKEKTKVITDLKLKEEKDIDKMISMEKQLKFLNEIPKKAQSKKPYLYEILYDKSDPANRFIPDREETLTLEKESRSKLNKDLVKPYDYTKQNSLYEIFKPAL